MLEGGHDYDGRPIVPFDEAGMRAAARRIRDERHRARSRSPRSSRRSTRAARSAAREILAEECPDAAVTLSHDLGRIGLLERENAALLNAALVDLARRHGRRLSRGDRGKRHRRPALSDPERRHGDVGRSGDGAAGHELCLGCDQLDARRGASCRGSHDAMVVDVGGTSTDVGQLRRGFPREANSVVEIGGVRTLFRMPDLLSIGLGGGSIVDPRDPLAVGPQSVGYRLTQEALVFGGTTLTATDMAVAAGLARDRRSSAARRRSRRASSRAVLDRRRGEARGRGRPDEDRGRRVPLIAVGGGAFLVPDRLAGISRGDPRAAWRLRQCGRRRDRAGQRRDRPGLSRPDPRRGDRRRRSAGRTSAPSPPAPIRASLKTVDVEDMPLAYLPGNALRVRVRVAGALDRIEASREVA